MNQYEQHLADRKARLIERAEAAEAEAVRLDAEAKEMADRIPFGQPILVGHHSEKSDRAYRARFSRKWDKAAELRQKARRLRERAESVGRGGVSSDDPEALLKLRRQLEERRRGQEHMKAANRAIRLKDRAKGDAALADMGFDLGAIQKLRQPDEIGRIGFPDYALTNNNAQIRRLEKRVEDLEGCQSDTSSAETIGDVEIIDNVEDNRTQVVFPDKPAEAIRKQLKSAGFRWAPSLGVWQRQRSATALERARQIVNQ